jgi:hypothetical protein
MKNIKKEVDNQVKYGTVSLPIPLINTIKEKIKGTGLPSVSAYVAYVLRQVLSESDSDKEILNEKSEEDVRKRLKKLGYI